MHNFYLLNFLISLHACLNSANFLLVKFQIGHKFLEKLGKDVANGKFNASNLQW